MRRCTPLNPALREAVAGDLWGSLVIQRNPVLREKEKRKEKKFHKRFMNIVCIFSKNPLLSIRKTAFSISRKWHTGRDAASCLREKSSLCSLEKAWPSPFCSGKANVASPDQKHMQQWSLWTRCQLTHATGSRGRQDLCYLLRQWSYGCRLDSLCEAWSSRTLIKSR